jgi:hypothetical protein
MGGATLWLGVGTGTGAGAEGTEDAEGAAVALGSGRGFGTESSVTATGFSTSFDEHPTSATEALAMSVFMCSIVRLRDSFSRIGSSAYP